jgi:transposase
MAGQILTMSQKEISKMEVMKLLKEKVITQKEASERLKLSIRQVRRIYARYQAGGACGLVSHKRGKASNNKIPEEVIRRAVELIKSKYVGFGPTLAMEKLHEVEGIKLSRETLRKVMIGNGIWWAKKRKTLRVHQQRERRTNFGELIQIDGSHHDWFEGRNDKCCLLVFVDDATSKLVQLKFCQGETTEGYFEATKEYIQRVGVPVAFYSDKDGIFRINMPESTSEGETQFQRACRELDIKLIYAHSPQAKGRVERANGILQDRLVKELRLRGINDIETANAYLPEFINMYNARFAKVAKNNLDMHRKLDKNADELELIFSEQTERKLSKNLEFSYKNMIYQMQVTGQGYGLRYAKVMVHKNLSGKVRIICMGRERQYKCYQKSKLVNEVVEAKEINLKVDSFVKWKPAKDHPWRRFKISGNALPVGCHT